MANRILIADDNETLVQTLALLFEMNGYVVTTAFSVDVAILLLNEQPFDFLLFNLKIGNRSGEEILRHLGTSIEVRPRVIIAMTAGVAEHELRRVREEASAVLVRPFSFEDLLAEVKRHS